jgi:hypothetical protein
MLPFWGGETKFMNKQQQHLFLYENPFCWWSFVILLKKKLKHLIYTLTKNTFQMLSECGPWSTHRKVKQAKEIYATQMKTTQHTQKQTMEQA